MSSRRPSAPSTHANRNPGRALQAVRTRNTLSAATKASKALTRADNKRRQMLLEDDVDTYFIYRASEVTRLAVKHSVKEEVVRKLLCNVSQFKARWRPNLRNAIVHDLAVKAREAGDRKALNDLQEDLADAVEDGELTADASLMDEAEKKRLIDQLVEYRNTQRRGMRATNKSAAMDGLQTANGIRDALLDLFERTGIRGFAFLSRGNPDDAALPHCIDSDDALEFFPQILDMPYVDILRGFERFSCTLDNGTKESNDVGSVRKQIVALVLAGLRTTSKDKTASMSYDNYDYDIRELKKVELRGWPVDIELQRPSKLCAEDARTIRDGLRDGSIVWHRMTSKEHAELVKKHAAQRRRTGEPIKKRGPRSDKNTKRGLQKGKAAAKAKAVVRDEGSDDSEEENEDESEDESGKGSDDNEEAPIASTLRRARASAAPAASSALAATAAATVASAPAQHLFNPTSPDPSAFDFSSFDNIDFTRMPTLNLDNYAFGNMGVAATEEPAFPPGSLAAHRIPLPAPAPTPPATTLVPAMTSEPGPVAATRAVHLGASSASASVFVASTNGTATKSKRKSAEAPAGSTTKKARTSAHADSDSAPPKVRKERSDKGQPRKHIDENAPPHERKVRSDKGVPRKKKDA
ncbi:hypothetical protein FB451DRAFT_1469460 [Mycena latifolia]|nr:hypothetical protein FB451DRAFT_1469460 [Mycena latifolia]